MIVFLLLCVWLFAQSVRCECGEVIGGGCVAFHSERRPEDIIVVHFMRRKLMGLYVRL